MEFWKTEHLKKKRKESIQNLPKSEMTAIIIFEKI